MSVIPDPGNVAQVDAAVSGDQSIQLLNAQASQLVGAAFQSYGGLPNPRAAVSALQTNSAPAVTAAMQLGNPAFDSILNAAPIAGPLVAPASRITPLAPQQPLRATDEETANLKDWNSLNDFPIADVRWLSWLQGSKDGAKIKRWQNYLNANQWYQGKQPLAVSGHWDTNSMAALHAFLIARFTPSALYSQDTSTRSRASTFLSAIGFDANGIQAQMGDDPQWHNEVVTRWMHTHGPDTTMRNSLNEWSNLYGDANIPDAIRHLKQTWYQSISDGIPFIGQLFPWSSSRGSDFASSQLTKAEQEAIAPALQDAHNNLGVFGILNGYDAQRTKAILGARYFFGDLFGQGKLENPWDTNSKTGKFIDAHQNNLFAGLFGDDAYNKNPGLGDVANIFMNIADDPISYTGIGLESKTIGEGAKFRGLFTGDTTIRGGQLPTRMLLLHPSVIRDAFRAGDGGSHMLDTLLRPNEAARRELANMLGQAPWNDMAHASALIGERNSARLHIVQQIIDEKDPGRRLEMLRQHYAYKIHDPSFAMNMTEAMKTYSPRIWSRLTEGKKARLWWGGVGGQVNRGRQVNIDDAFDLRDAIHLQGVVHNIPQAKVWELMNKALAPDMLVRRKVVDEMRSLIRQGIDAMPDKGVGFRQWVNNVRKGAFRSMSKDDQEYYLAIKDAGGSIVEASKKGLSGLTPEERDLLEQYDGDVKEATDTLKAQLIDLKNRVGDNHPEYLEAQKLIEKQIEDLRETQRSVAAFSPQFNQWERWEYTPYEMLAYNSPALRRAEFVQRKMGIDQAMNLWKRAVLLKPASSLSITLGDETTRFLLSALADGHPRDVVRYFVNMVKTMLRKGEITELPSDLFFNAAKMFGEYHWDDHIPYDVGSPGYVDASQHYFNELVAGGPEAKVWTQAMKDAGGTRKEQQALAEERLIDWLTGSTTGGFAAHDENAMEFLKRAGIDPTKLGGLTKKEQETVEKLRRMTVERGATAPEAAVAAGKAKKLVGKTRELIRPVARQIHGNFQGITKYSRGSREDLFNWVDRVANGGKRMTKNEVKDLVHRLRSNDPDALPVVVGRRLYAPGSPGANPFARMSNWYFHHITDTWVNNQRRVGYGIKLRQYEQQIRAFHSDWTEPEILNQAASEAKQWVLKNTYQGHRSMMATASRDLFPFFGATANMSRFFMRQWARHPFTIDPSAHFLEWQNQNAQSGGLHLPAPVGSAFAMFGFNSGDDLTFDPSYAFFFSRDGLSGYLPGLGPLAMVPVKMAAQANPDVAAALKTLPGFEYVDAQSPMIPWFERGVSALSIGASGQSVLEGVPLVGRPSGYYERRELDAAQQQHAQFLAGKRGQDVNAASVRGQVAAETGLQSLTSFLAPLNVQSQDPMRAKLQPAVKAFDAATSEEQKLQVLQQNPDAAPLLMFYDPSLWNKLHPDQPMEDTDVRRTLAAQYSWVQPYATGKVASAAPGTQSGAEASQAAYEQDLSAGRLRYLGVDDFINKMLKNDEYNDAWSQYEAVHQTYISWLLQTGNSTSSAAARQYRVEYVDPIVEELGHTHGEWYQQFVKQTDRSFAGMDVRSAPLRSLMSWEVMPRFDNMESPLTLLWRQALVYRDNAATALMAARGSSGEQQYVLAALQQQMKALADSDPSGVFGAQINRFSFSKLSDLVGLEAETEYNRLAYGQATA